MPNRKSTRVTDANVEDRYSAAVEIVRQLPDAYARGLILEAKRRIVQLQRESANGLDIRDR